LLHLDLNSLLFILCLRHLRDSADIEYIQCTE
jgi:hypothetical protein